MSWNNEPSIKLRSTEKEWGGLVALYAPTSKHLTAELAIRVRVPSDDRRARVVARAQ